MKRLFALIFWLSNQAVDFGYDAADQVERDGGLRFSLCLKLPLVLRRLKCSHSHLCRIDGPAWCFRCERAIPAVKIRNLVCSLNPEHIASTRFHAVGSACDFGGYHNGVWVFHPGHKAAHEKELR